MRKFRESYPLDFELLNEQGEHAFFIQDTSEKVTLSITNMGSQKITFDPIPEGDLGAGNYHFLLRLRPKTIVDADKIELNNDAWSLAVAKENGLDCLYFRKNGNGNGGAAEIEAGGNLNLEMDKVLADNTLGSRDSNVELLYDHIVLKDTSERIHPARPRQVKWPIINHRGKPHLPLHVGFVGSNTILNNDEPNKLTLRVALLHPKKDSVRFKHDPDDSVRSKIFVSFDTGDETKEWAISEAAEGGEIKVSADLESFIHEDKALKEFTEYCAWWSGPQHLELTKKWIEEGKPSDEKCSSELLKMLNAYREQDRQKQEELKAKWPNCRHLEREMKKRFSLTSERRLEGDSAEFELSFSEDVPMGSTSSPGTKTISHFFDIEISNIKTAHPSGLTNCYVRFENIPGYWDHTFVCPIQKQPMVFKGDKVGIGKNPPSAELDVQGDANVSGALRLAETGKGRVGVITQGGELLIHTSGKESFFAGRGAGNLEMGASESNTAIGASALCNNTTGGANTANGVSALKNNMTGGGNTAIGISALKCNTTGGSNERAHKNRRSQGRFLSRTVRVGGNRPSVIVIDVG